MLIATIVLVSLITAFWVAWPLMHPRKLTIVPRATRTPLELQREKLLGELKELEFDRRMGKIELAEYTPLRAELAAQASQVLKRIEAARAAQNETVEPVEEARAANWERDIEIEILIARARQRLAATSSDAENWRCECGREMNVRDRFCASCGAARSLVAAV